jgi:serine/threonine protein kinase
MTGQRVGNWILLEELGRGPLGVVYKAHAADDVGHWAAVKLLHPDPTRDADWLAKFPAELLALHRLNHPNVVKFYDAGTLPGGVAWYAAEFVDGDDCAALLKTRPKRPDEPGLNWKDEVIPVAVQLARALKHGHHRSILHRNLKPSNVLIARDGTVKVADFGVAKSFALSPLNLPADAWGTAGYLAPEHFTGKPLTRRSDLYALGGVLYTLTTGRPPFTGATTAEFLHKHCYTLPDRPAHFVRDLPADLDDLICALLAKDPARRPATPAAVIEWLDQVRGKVERKGKKVPWPPDSGDASGPMPALTEEDERAAERDDAEPRHRPLMSRPLVVVPLFLAVLGLILALVFWPRPSADDLYKNGTELMQSEDPADWDRAWAEYLEPLQSYYPGRYAADVAAAKAKIDDRKSLRRAIEQGSHARYKSDGERLYHHGLGLARAGDAAGARRLWNELIRAFADVEPEARWVKLARVGLADLERRPPAAPPGNSPALAAALDRARAMKAEGKASEAAVIFDALADLYRDNPAALELIRKMR